ncbi:hypothetical protein [uncultured Methanobacterium sp.]|uniref:hypothetical protein n=1 Tax=uncultured Methanobacterium sp. TaxID=176306 RepID=UPI002AA828C3|nr:hypothetical protein [uncultured Methanobacterium sp.]
MNLPVLSTIIAIVGMLIVILLNLKKKTREGLSASKLSFGCNRKYYLILPLIILGILILESVILYLTGSGLPVADFNLYEFLITLASYFVLYLLCQPGPSTSGTNWDG